jgi:hypothetical protein
VSGAADRATRGLWQERNLINSEDTPLWPSRGLDPQVHSLLGSGEKKTVDGAGQARPLGYPIETLRLRFAVVRDPRQVVPLAGSWTGVPSDLLGMTVEVSVTSDVENTAADQRPHRWAHSKSRRPGLVCRCRRLRARPPAFRRRGLSL